MKILVVLVHWGLGGSSISMIPLVLLLKQKGNEVIIICHKEDAMKKTFEDLGFRTILQTFPSAMNVTAMDQFYSRNEKTIKFVKDLIKFPVSFFIFIRLLLREKPSFVFAGDFPLLSLICASRLLSISTVTFVRTSLTRDFFRRLFTEKILSLSNYIVGISKTHMRQLRSYRHESLTHKHFVIHNTISYKKKSTSDFLSFYESLRVKTENVIMFVGGVSIIKGSLEFARIAKLILNINKNVTFLLVGSFNVNFSSRYASGNSSLEYQYNKKFFDYVEKNHSPETFKIIGQTAYVMELLSLSQLLLAPSLYPHFLRPIIEAWSLRKPVIVADDEFNSEWITNGVNGVLLAPYDLLA